MLNIALPKGRLGSDVYAIFSQYGYDCEGIDEENRRLVFENAESGIRYLLVKPADVPIYVVHGVADIGIVGKDVLLEEDSDVYELLDLRLGACKIAVAGKRGFTEDLTLPLRVATKYKNIAQKYYAGLNRRIEIIKLSGSIELAPVLGMSDVIVDIVETGRTLEENDLEVISVIAESSARLIANKSSYKFKTESIEGICSKIASQLSGV